MGQRFPQSGGIPDRPVPSEFCHVDPAPRRSEAGLRPADALDRISSLIFQDSDADDAQTVMTDVELALADAEWRHEVECLLGHAVSEDLLVPPTLRGEAGTPLRRAFEARRAALLAWRAARGIS